MARGWESKAVASQREDAAAARPCGRTLAPEAQARRARRETLLLALARAQAELAAACRPAHRDMAGLRIDALQRELAALDAADGT